MFRPRPTLLASLRYAMVVVALSSFAANAGPIRLKFAFFSSDREFAFRGVVKPFADAVNLAAGGAVEVEVYPGGALGRGYAQQAQLVLSGAADFAWIQPPMTPGLFPDNDIIELPGLFRDAQEATEVYGRIVASGVLRGFENFVVVGAMGSRPTTIHTRTPIASLADLKDKRIRTNGGMSSVTVAALGMRPVVIPINQTAEAINAGTVDGAMAGTEAIVDFGISRFVNYHYMLGFGTVPFMLVMNKEKFQSLPEFAQNVIRKYSGEWVGARYVATVSAYDDEIVRKWKSEAKRNVVDPSPADLKQAEIEFAKITDKWAGTSPRNAELLHSVRAEIGKVRELR